MEYGPARQVINDPQHPYTKALLSVVPDRDPRRRKTAQILSGETPNPVAIPTGCRFRPRCPIAQDPCTEVDPQLELARGAHPDPTKLPASLPKAAPACGARLANPPRMRDVRQTALPGSRACL